VDTLTHTLLGVGLARSRSVLGPILADRRGRSAQSEERSFFVAVEGEKVLAMGAEE